MAKIPDAERERIQKQGNRILLTIGILLVFIALIALNVKI